MIEPISRKLPWLAEFALSMVSARTWLGDEGDTLLHGYVRFKDYPEVSAEAVEWLHTVRIRTCGKMGKHRSYWPSELANAAATDARPRGRYSFGTAWMN
jgi:hypothetical protein